MPQVTVLPIPPLAHETHYGRETLVFSQRPANFNEVVAQSVARYPDKTALVFEGRRWTYRRLMDEANAFAATIHTDYGTGKGDRVAVLTGNTPEFAIAAIGISLLGAILVPLNTRLTAQELLFMLDNSGTSVLVTSIRS